MQQDLKIRGWYRVIRGIIRFLLRIVARVSIEGQEYAPKQGPYILAANHLHWLDTPVYMVALPVRARVFAGEKWEKHWLIGPLLRSVGAIFVRRGEVDRKALREALGWLKAGGVLGMAPEGTRSKTGALQKGRSGGAYMAYHSGVPIVPMVSWGQERVFSSLRRLRRGRVHVAFGPPFQPPPVPPGQKITTADLEAFTEEIMARLAAMLPPEYRGVYADVVIKRPELVTSRQAER